MDGAAATIAVEDGCGLRGLQAIALAVAAARRPLEWSGGAANVCVMMGAEEGERQGAGEGGRKGEGGSG